MADREPARSVEPSAPGAVVLSARLASFKRLYRWLNLTLIHQALWPLLVLVASAPVAAPPRLPLGWYAARIAGPALAALLAAVYLAQRPLPVNATAQADGPTVTSPRTAASDGQVPALRVQARFVLIGLPLMVAAARLVVGPPDATAKLLLFGLADVAAFQMIHFGVVVRSFPEEAQGQAAAVLLFGLSWGLRELLLAGVRGTGASLGLAFAGGLLLGLAVGLLSRALRIWPGGILPAAATQWLLIYLIFGFVQ